MFSVEHLLELGLFSQVIPIWQVFMFIAVLVPLLLLYRVRLCLFVTYLFTFYFGFLVYWGDYLAATGAMAPFILYALSGIIVAIVFVVLVFKEEGFRLHLSWRRQQLQMQEYGTEQND